MRGLRLKKVSRGLKRGIPPILLGRVYSGVIFVGGFEGRDVREKEAIKRAGGALDTGDLYIEQSGITKKQKIRKSRGVAFHSL